MREKKFICWTVVEVSHMGVLLATRESGCIRRDPQHERSFFRKESACNAMQSNATLSRAMHALGSGVWVEGSPGLGYLRMELMLLKNFAEILKGQ